MKMNFIHSGLINITPQNIDGINVKKIDIHKYLFVCLRKLVYKFPAAKKVFVTY